MQLNAVQSRTMQRKESDRKRVKPAAVGGRCEMVVWSCNKRASRRKHGAGGQYGLWKEGIGDAKLISRPPSIVKLRWGHSLGISDRPRRFDFGKRLC
jgi:hypothetical protein